MIKGAWKTWVIHINLAGCTDETSGSNSAKKVFRSRESLRKRGYGFQTEGAADIKLLRPYRLHFIFGTHKSLECELRRAQAGTYLVTKSRR
jgi:hypothetical protein